MIARRIFIAGHVQGVFFREWTVDGAHELGLGGWVRNWRDGRVEVFVQGEAAAVETLIERLHRGSPASKVTEVAVEPAEVADVTGFTRRQTT